MLMFIWVLFLKPDFVKRPWELEMCFMNKIIIIITLQTMHYSRGRQRRSWSADVLQSLAQPLKKTQLPVALVILKTLISMFRCVW